MCACHWQHREVFKVCMHHPFLVAGIPLGISIFGGMWREHIVTSLLENYFAHCNSLKHSL